MKRLFIDLTGVVLDMEGYKEIHTAGKDVDYSKVETYPGAMEAIQEIIDIDCCEICLMPDINTPSIMDYVDISGWVKDNFPSLYKQYTLGGTMDCIAEAGDMLITNREHKFIGLTIDFSRDDHNWQYIIDIIESAIHLEMP